MQKILKVSGIALILFIGLLFSITTGTGSKAVAKAVTSDTITNTAILRPSLQAQYSVTVKSGVVYGTAPVSTSGKLSNTSLLLDLYTPTGTPTGLHPVIVMVHGGAFFRGTRQEPTLVAAAKAYAARGYVVASIDYRLGGGPNYEKNKFVPSDQPVVGSRVQAYQALVMKAKTLHFLDYMGPDNAKLVDPVARLGQVAALEDTLTALDWVQSQQAALSLDLSRLVMMGGSAGSITSLYTTYALDDLKMPAPHIAAMLDFWGSFNLDSGDAIPDGATMMEPGEAPLMIVHGTADPAVPIIFGQAIFTRTGQIGIPIEFIPMPGRKHGFESINVMTDRAVDGQTIFQRSVDFLDKALYTNQVLRPSLQAQYSVTVKSGVVYGTAPVSTSGKLSNTSLLLDLYTPTGTPTGLHPVIVMVHGGAFFWGTRQEPTLVAAAKAYAARGYVVASIDYRLGGGPNYEKNKFVPSDQPVVGSRVQAYQALVMKAKTLHFLDYMGPDNAKLVDPVARLGQVAALEDTLTALDWVQSQQAALSLDLSRLVMMGGSAGSITSLYTTYALDDLKMPAPHIAAMLDFWGSFNLDSGDAIPDGATMMEPGEAPLMIVHGTADPAVPIIFGQAIFTRTGQIGIPIEFIPMPGRKHGFESINVMTDRAVDGQTIFQRSVNFLDKVLFAN